MNRLIIFFLLISFGAIGQNENQSSEYFKMTETDSLYYIAIEKYIVEIDSFYNKYSNQKQPNKIFIEYQDYLMKIPDSINGYEIKKIGPKAIGKPPIYNRPQAKRILESST